MEKLLVDVGRQAGRVCGGVSITVLFGNRDASISNKTGKRRQMAWTRGCNLNPKSGFVSLFSWLAVFPLPLFSLAAEVADICRVHLKRKKCVRGVWCTLLHPHTHTHGPPCSVSLAHWQGGTSQAHYWGRIYGAAASGGEKASVNNCREQQLPSPPALKSH